MHDVSSWSLEKWGTPLLVFRHAVSLFNFFLVSFIWCIANFCEVVCRGILYQDLRYSCFVCYIIHHSKLIVLSNVFPVFRPSDVMSSVRCLVHCNFVQCWGFPYSPALPHSLLYSRYEASCHVWLLMTLINSVKTLTHFTGFKVMSLFTPYSKSY